MQSKLHRLLNWALLVGPAFLLLAIDQGSKWLVRSNLAVGEAWAPIPALAKFFTFTHVQNTGVAFGQLPGLGWLFMLVNVIVVICVFVFYPRIPEGQWILRVSAVLILVGALGNVTDRMRVTLLVARETGDIWNALPYAYVTDFFDIKIWPVWNVADMCVVSGVAILGWWLWQSEKEAAAASDAAATDA